MTESNADNAWEQKYQHDVEQGNINPQLVKHLIAWKDAARVALRLGKEPFSPIGFRLALTYEGCPPPVRAQMFEDIKQTMPSIDMFYKRFNTDIYPNSKIDNTLMIVLGCNYLVPGDLIMMGSFCIMNGIGTLDQFISYAGEGMPSRESLSALWDLQKYNGNALDDIKTVNSIYEYNQFDRRV